MAKRHHEEEKTGKGLIAGIIILAILIAAAGAYLYYGVINKPTMVLGAPNATVEAGEEFDQWSMVRTLDHATEEQVEIDLGRLDTNSPGEYKIKYTLKTHFGEESLPVTVTVSDTTPPELKVVEGVQEKLPGDTVNVQDLVVEAKDRTPVTCHFADGTDTYTFEDGGDITLTVTASDEEGNVTSADVAFHVTVIKTDEEAPVISGAVNTAVKLGESFDPLEGITVSDDMDEAPQITADVTSVDTSVTGGTLIHYTATDNTGKTSEAERIVTVASDVIEYDGRKYGVYWDLAGVSGQPYLVACNRTMNTVTVYTLDEGGRYTKPILSFVCSTGGNTPEGYYKTLERYRWHYLYDNCWGQYATRIVGHILFHSVPYNTENPADLEYEEYNLLGTPASLGCIRMKVEDVKWVYDNCPQGFPCVIYDDSVTAGPLGTPDFVKIDPADERRGWDPSDPDPNNPWLAQQ